MKKARPYLIILIIISALTVIKIKFFQPHKPKEQRAGKNGKPPAVPVTVFVTGNDRLENKIYANGTIVANEEAELKAEANGRITYLNLPEGKYVSKGTLLVKVNDAEYRAQMEKLKGQLSLLAGVESRQRHLLSINGISKQEYETAYTNLISMKADSAYLQAQIGKTELYAPFSGIVGIRNISMGSYITPSSTVAVIQQIDPVKIDFSLPEKYSSIFKAGDAIVFKVEGSNKTYSGKIYVVDPSVDPATRNIRFRAVSPNPDGQLYPGTFARVELKLKENRNTLFVPTEAVVPVAKGKKIYLVKNGLAEEKIIETGIRTEDYVQVLSGMEPGDSVVVNGNFQLKNKAPVRLALHRGK